MPNLVFDLPIEIQDKIFTYKYKRQYDEVINEYMYSKQRMNAVYKIIKWNKVKYLRDLKQQLLNLKNLITQQNNNYNNN